ncbi:MAG: diaminopimelate epimerase [Phaeodactylibacter sp.]|uniref:diaminopimelate epimerase n=1 Tax=Phaeodactylibacter sp. TaxID=1940289 RepID=UPI0032EFB870
MKRIQFSKFQGTGNDFIMINQLTRKFLDGSETAIIQQLCDRRFGIGADGLILLQSKTGYDFEMDYFNADGRRGSMCGNGARCTIAFARTLGLDQKEYYFYAPDGPHRGRLSPHKDGWIEIEMTDVEHVEQGIDYFFLDTGSPHYVQFVDNLDGLDVEAEGKRIRYGDRFAGQGTNVNFVSAAQNLPLKVNTYERGVEAETLSCGTGVTAAAIAYLIQSEPATASGQTVTIQTKGGQLDVRLEKQGSRFHNIWLCGPAVEVFQGHLYI